MTGSFAQNDGNYNAIALFEGRERLLFPRICR